MSDGFTSVVDRLTERRLSCYSTPKMAFGLDFSGGNVSEMNTFYSGQYWPAACMDMNNNGNYAQDTSEYSIFPNIDIFLS